MNIQALIFDFDGVLVDSVEIKTKAFAKLFEPFGEDIAVKVVEHHRNNGGMNRIKKFEYYYEHFLNMSLSAPECDRLCITFSELVVDGVVNATEIKGAMDFIKTNYKKIPCFLNSATPDNELNEIVEKREMNQYFKEIRGADNSKTKNLQIIIDKYHLDPLKCVFWGDALSDYNASIKCNVPFIGIVPVGGSPLLNERPEIKWYHDFTEFNLYNLEVFID